MSAHNEACRASGRTEIQPDHLYRSLEQIRLKTEQRLEQKGPGTFASSHETYGIIAEEVAEALQAVRANSQPALKRELLDIAVACAIGIACIDQGSMDW